MVRARARASASACMKAPLPVFTSRTSAPEPSAIFLLMIELAMSGMHSTVEVMSRSAYSFLSAGASPAPAAQMTPPTSRSCASISSGLTSARQPRIDSSLSSVPPGVAEPTAGELRDADPVRGDQRHQRQRDLVAHASRGVLVGGRAEVREVHALTARDHRGGPAGDLGPGHAAQEDRHGQGRHLLVGDDSTRVRIDDPVDLRVAQRTAVALGADDVDGIHQFAHDQHTNAGRVRLGDDRRQTGDVQWPRRPRPARRRARSGRSAAPRRR